jgi:hypothetical protein
MKTQVNLSPYTKAARKASCNSHPKQKNDQWRAATAEVPSGCAGTRLSLQVAWQMPEEQDAAPHLLQQQCSKSCHACCSACTTQPTNASSNKAQDDAQIPGIKLGYVPPPNPRV